MAIDVSISGMTSATTPLAGTEVLPIVTGGSNFKVSVANLTAGRSVSATALALSSADLTFSSTGQKIIADMTNAVRASRLNFQTSSANSTSGVGIIPSGSATTASWVAYAAADPDNAAFGQFHADSAHIGINSSKTGTGVTQPIEFQIDNVTKAAVSTSGILRAYSSLSVGASYTSNTPPSNGAIFQGSVAIGKTSASTPLDVTGIATFSGKVQNSYNYSSARFGDANSGVFIYQNGTTLNGIIRESASNKWALGHASSEIGTVVDDFTWDTTGKVTAANMNLSGLTASQAVVTDSSKNLASLAYASAATSSTLVVRDTNGDSTFRAVTVTQSVNSSTANLSTTGVLRFASSDTIFGIRNNANNADLTLTKNTNDTFLLNGSFAAASVSNSYSTTVTAAGTTTLTVASNGIQDFTGATTQTVKMPVVTTLANGFTFQINNYSSGTVTVQSSGANTIISLTANQSVRLWVKSTAGGTGTASWGWTAAQTLAG